MTELSGYQACNWARLRNWRALRSGSNRACSNRESFLRVRLLPNPCRGQRELQQKSFDVVLSFFYPGKARKNSYAGIRRIKPRTDNTTFFPLFSNRFSLGSRVISGLEPGVVPVFWLAPGSSSTGWFRQVKCLVLFYCMWGVYFQLLRATQVHR